MTSIVRVKEHDACFAKLEIDQGVAYELREFFSFYSNGYQFHPKFKAKMWDGKIRLFDPRTKFLYVGLLDALREFCDDFEYKLVDETAYSEKVDVSEDIAQEIADKIGLNPKYVLRDYQKKYIYEAIRDSRSVNLSPTSSGKSLIIHIIRSYYKTEFNARTLIVVPTVGLVKQMAGDLIDYGTNPDEIHEISAGKSKNTDKSIVISTWQSLARIEDKEWFKQFDVVLGDEAHTFAAKSLQDIMTSMTNAFWRHGFTGTIGSDSKVNKMVLEGLFGKVRKFVSTDDLIKSGTVADFRVEAIILKHDKEIAKIFSKELKKLDGGAKKYFAEREFLSNNHARNIFITKLVMTRKGENSLILFDLVEKHGKVLQKYLQKIPDVKIHFVHGGTPADERERVRQEVENDENKNHVILASFGVFSTGISIKRLDYCMFAAGSKSEIRVLQSIGRVLRKGNGSDDAVLFDISDDITGNNYTLNHFKKRMEIYAKENFDVRVHNFNLK